MRGFNNIFPLSSGLVSVDNYMHEQKALHGCVNLRPVGDVLMRFEKPQRARNVMDFPFPQIWEGNKYRIVVTRQEIIINETERLKNDGHLFDFADFHDFVLGVSPTTILYREVANDRFVLNGVGSIPTGDSMVNNNGQLLVGGLTGSWYNTPKQTICWSHIASTDFFLDNTNESGYMVLQNVNEIYKLLKLGEFIIAYTDRGMYKCVPTGLAYGFVKINDIAAVSTGTIAGTVNKHIFISSDSYLYLVTNSEVKKLGYSWLSRKLNILTARILYNAHTQDFYITDGLHTFILCDDGLFETTIIPTAFYKDFSGDLFYTGIDYTDLIYFETPWIRFGRVGLKTLETFDFVTHPEDLKMDLTCIVASHGSGIYHKKCVLNDNNNTTPLLTGNSFKIIGSSNYEMLQDYTIASLNLRVKYCDRRNFRAGGGNYGTSEEL